MMNEMHYNKIYIYIYTTTHETNGWENVMFDNDLTINVNNPHKNVSFTNTKEIEAYDF